MPKHKKYAIKGPITLKTWTDTVEAVEPHLGSSYGRFAPLKDDLARLIRKLKPGRVVCFGSGNGPLPENEINSIQSAVRSWITKENLPIRLRYAKKPGYFVVMHRTNGKSPVGKKHA